MLEIWKDIQGYEGRYQVSNLGNVKSLKDNLGRPREKLRSLATTNQGYKKVDLHRKEDKPKSKYVHRLVVEAFLPNPENNPMVNHKDSNPSNKHIENLEWCTQAENVQHGYREGNMKPARHRLGARTSQNKFKHTYFEKARNRWVASVEILNTKGVRAKTKTFSVKKHGSALAELLAAQAVNQILEELNDSERSKNTFTEIELKQLEDINVKETKDRT